MSVFLKQAKIILESVKIDDPRIKEAKEYFSSLKKEAGLGDIIHDPKFQNIVNLLNPFVTNYKVNQVLRLLKELAKDQKQDISGPGTGVRRFI